MRRSNRVDYKSATRLELEVISTGKPLQIGKTTTPGVALIAAMDIVVQENQGLFGKLFIGIKPA